MSRRPRRSALYPYTTLFRSHPCTGNYAFSLKNPLEDYDLRKMAEQLDDANEQIRRMLGVTPKTFAYPCGQRSEEHTSELQSLRHLVCRLLLEKKNLKNRH